MTSNSNVIVTDGFTGNIALKTAEGTAKFITNNLKKTLTEKYLQIIFIFSYFALKNLKINWIQENIMVHFLRFKWPSCKKSMGIDSTRFLLSLLIYAIR